MASKSESCDGQLYQEGPASGPYPVGLNFKIVLGGPEKDRVV